MKMEQLDWLMVQILTKDVWKSAIKMCGVPSTIKTGPGTIRLSFVLSLASAD